MGYISTSWDGKYMCLPRCPVCIVGKSLSVGMTFGVCLGEMFFVSSPKHEVLKVSYCDQYLSVVRRPSVRPSVRRQHFLQTTSPPRPVGQFQNNFTQMFLL